MVDDEQALLQYRSRHTDSFAYLITLPHHITLTLCSYVFHYVVERGITYLCLADEKQKRRIPFLFLEDVKGRFQQTYGDRAATAIAFAMNAEFARVLQERLVRFRRGRPGKAKWEVPPRPLRSGDLGWKRGGIDFDTRGPTC